MSVPLVFIMPSFDPRPREGGDRVRAVLAAFHRGCFDPRPREGGDVIQRQAPVLLDVSIHAPARGATQQVRQPRRIAGFRSTPPRGGRPKDFHPCIRVQGVSIHAPARGATAYLLSTSAFRRLFRSTPPRGGRPQSGKLPMHHARFRSTPPRGGRPCVSSSCFHYAQFRSTPPRGGRHIPA